jgi:hypothetical protein
MDGGHAAQIPRTLGMTVGPLGVTIEASVDGGRWTVDGGRWSVVGGRGPCSPRSTGLFETLELFDRLDKW